MSPYRGRFAPSPTGPLHFGSLFAAVVSYLDAKAHNGEWLLRVEDIDPPRETSGAKEHIITTLQAHGLHWDGVIRFQSQQSELYERTLATLEDKGFIYACPCSRKYLSEHNGEHSNNCPSPPEVKRNVALRFKGADQCFHWSDRFQGAQETCIHEDFVLKRKDGLFAYQLAVVCDDIDQGITHVVRGHDLIDSTPMQLAIYTALEKAAPEFAHFPVIFGADSQQKLSKQNMAEAVQSAEAYTNIERVMRLLGLNLSSRPDSIDAWLNAGLENWAAISAHLCNKVRLLANTG